MNAYIQPKRSEVGACVVGLDVDPPLLPSTESGNRP